MLSRSIHAIAKGSISFFLINDNIPLDMHRTFSLAIHLFGHICFFCMLSIVKSGAFNMGVQIVISFYLVFLGFGLLDNMEVLSLVFSLYLHIIFHSGLPTYFPINST